MGHLFVYSTPIKLNIMNISIFAFHNIMENLLTISHSCIQWWSTYDHCMITADAVPEVLNSLSMTNTIVINEGISTQRLTSLVVITHILSLSLDP